MSIIKLTENLENFQWTDYESIGDTNNPQTFSDGMGKPPELIVTGQKTFERPDESALVTMQSEFAVQSEPGTRGPYSLSDFMDGTKQGRGFIYPGGAPLGFTMDMESLEGHTVSQIVVDGKISLTPLSYTVSGVSFEYDRTLAYIPDIPEPNTPSFLDFTRGSAGLGRIGLISPNWNPYEFSSTAMLEFGPDAPSLPYVIPETEYTGPIPDFVDTFDDIPKLDHAHSTDSLSRLLSYPGLYVGSTGNIVQGQDVRPSISSPGWQWTSIDGPFDHTELRSRLYDVYQHHFQLTDVNFVNIPYGNDLFDETGATTPWKVGSIHIGTDDIAGVLGGGVNYYGDLKSLAGRSSIYMDDAGEYRVPTIEATTVPPGITEQYPIHILDFTGDQITHNIPQITLSGPFGDEDYQSTLQLTPISADAHGSNTVPLENYVSQYSPDDPFWPNYSSPWPDKIFHELLPEGTKTYGNFDSIYPVPFNHLNLNLNPFLNQITLDMFGNMSYVTFEGWKQGSIHIGSTDTAGGTWEDMTFTEADKTREVYQHHFLTSPFTQITVGTDLFDESGDTTPWKDGSIHIIGPDGNGEGGDSPGEPHSFFRTNADMTYSPSIEGTKFYTSFGGTPDYTAIGTIWEGYDFSSNNSYFNPPFSHLSLDVSPYKNMAIIEGASHTPYWMQGSIHISGDVEEASTVGGGTLQFANLDAFNPLGTPFESIYQNPDNMKYTRPSDFDDISENFQRTFNVQAPHPNNMFAYTIGNQFGYSYSARYISDSFPGQSADLFPTLYEDFTLSDELTGEVAGTALSAIFYQAQADNPDWPYKGIGIGDRFKFLPQRTEMRGPTVYSDFQFGRMAEGEDPWWKGGRDWWTHGWGNRSEENPEGGYHFTWTEQLPDTYQPYIIKDVGQRDVVGRDHIVLASLAAVDDIQRINQWGASPIGKNWIRNQTFLQDLNPRPETRDFSMLGIQASILPFIHTQRHSTTFTGEGEDSYGNYWKNYEALGKPEAFFLDASTVEKWGYGTRVNDGFGSIGESVIDVDGDFGASTEHHYSRLTRLTNKFVMGTDAKEGGGFFSGLFEAAGNIFGRTPATPTQYVFSQKGPFNKPLLSGDVPGGGKPIPATYSMIGAKYLAPEGPISLASTIAYEETVADQVKFLRDMGNELTDKQNELRAEIIKKATAGDHAGANTISLGEYSDVDSRLKMITDSFDRRVLKEKHLDKEVEALAEAHGEALTKLNIMKYMKTLGSPGAHDSLTTVGEAYKSEVLGEETTGLGIIRKDKDSKSYITTATDNINMIPYGLDYVHPGTGQKIDDFIKFKFYDKYNKKPIIFRAILSGISDTISPEWDGTKYLGRPDQVYVYSGAERSISFTFNIYPNTKQELPVLLEKLNYLVGLCYPSFTKNNRMVAPFIDLTIGDMFVNTPGFLSSLSVDVDDVSTWETDPGLQFPKYITCGCEFTYVGKYLPSTLGKHYELGWLKDEGWNKERMGTINRTGKVPVRSKSRTHDMSKLFESMQPLNKGN